MLAQLRYAGLLEVCRIRQLGYPNRMLFEKFLKQYLVLQPAATDAPSLAALLTANQQLSATDYVLGHTKIFLKHAAAQKLHSARDFAYFSVVSRIQRLVRGTMKRRRFAHFLTTLRQVREAVRTQDRGLLQDGVARCVDLPNEGSHLEVVRTARNMLRRWVGCVWILLIGMAEVRVVCLQNKGGRQSGGAAGGGHCRATTGPSGRCVYLYVVCISVTICVFCRSGAHCWRHETSAEQPPAADGRGPCGNY